MSPINQNVNPIKLETTTNISIKITMRNKIRHPYNILNKLTFQSNQIRLPINIPKLIKLSIQSNSTILSTCPINQTLNPIKFDNPVDMSNKSNSQSNQIH